MAELTTLEEKLGEVTGLAMAAQGATEKVSGLVQDNELRETLDRMNAEAKETEERCTQLADELDGKKTAVLDKARETKQEATEMMKTYLGSDAEGLDGFEFLTMAEAGEVGHWEVLGCSARRRASRTCRRSSTGRYRSSSATSSKLARISAARRRRESERDALRLR
jgi:hypothetical protein